MSKFKVFTYSSENLQGHTGERGETYCVFMQHLENPLGSIWKWCATEQEAKDLSAKWTRQLSETHQLEEAS